MRIKPLTFLIVGIMVTFVWVVTVGYPLHRDYEHTAKEIEKSRERMADFEKTLAGIEQSIEDREQLQLTRDNLNSRLYTKQDLLKLFDNLREFASAGDLELIEITPPIEELLRLNRMVVDSLQPLYLNISLRLEGKYDQYGQFVAKIEESDYFRQANHCRIIGSILPIEVLQLQFGFRALLGTIEGEA